MSLQPVHHHTACLRLLHFVAVIKQHHQIVIFIIKDLDPFFTCRGVHTFLLKSSPLFSASLTRLPRFLFLSNNFWRSILAFCFCFWRSSSNCKISNIRLKFRTYFSKLHLNNTKLSVLPVSSFLLLHLRFFLWTVNYLVHQDPSFFLKINGIIINHDMQGLKSDLQKWYYITGAIVLPKK